MNIHYLHQSHHTHRPRRNGYRAFALGALLALGLAGCSSDELLPAAPEGGGDNAPDAQPRITITADMGAGASTRTGHDDVTDEGVKVNWAEGDAFAIHTLDANGNSTSSTIFTLVAGDASKASATFEGMAPVKGESYFICYPADVKVTSDKKGFYLDMYGQKQTDNNSTAHLSKFDPMQGHLVKEGDFSQISFTSDDTHKESGHRAALMTFNLTNISADLGTPERLVWSANNYAFSSLVVVGGSLVAAGSDNTFTLNLEKVTASGQSITAYMMISPLTIPIDGTLTITLEGSRKSYTFTSPVFTAEKEYERGMRYVANVDMRAATSAVITYDNTAPASSTYSGGSGSVASPYLISTSGDLKKLIENTNSEGRYFKLTRDITIAQGETWTPIGDIDTPFKGHFDGGGHAISGEMKGAAENLGFFGSIEEATITNLNVSANVTTTLTDDGPECAAGAIAGNAVGSTISNCTNTGAVKGTTYVSGVVGASDGCNLINCINTGAVASTDNVTNLAGGIVGYSYNSTIVGCANTGSVYAKFGGGIAGQIDVEGDNTIAIFGCFNTGLITIPSGGGDGQSIGAIIGSIGTGALSHCLYMHASGQSANLAACGNYPDNDYNKVAQCANIAALNAAVTTLNEGITTWKSAGTAGLPTCYLFQEGKDASNDSPVIALPASSGGIGNITDGGSALN